MRMSGCRCDVERMQTQPVQPQDSAWAFKGPKKGRALDGLTRGFTPTEAGSGLNWNMLMPWLVPTCPCDKVSNLGLTKEFVQAF